eukprot:766180-Hanusia_phi.AAC.2
MARNTCELATAGWRCVLDSREKFAELSLERARSMGMSGDEGTTKIQRLMGAMGAMQDDGDGEGGGGGGGGGGRNLRVGSPLSDRNVLIEMMMEMKQQLRSLQNDVRRVEEVCYHRLDGAEVRQQALESRLRNVDKREAKNFDMIQDRSMVLENSVKDALNEVSMLKSDIENDLKSTKRDLSNEINQMSNRISLSDSLIRNVESRTKDDKGAMFQQNQTMLQEVEKKVKALKEEAKLQHQQNLERFLVLERIMQKETEERNRGDFEVRQELSDMFVSTKNLLKQESQMQSDALKRIRSETIDAIRSDTDNVDKSKDEVSRFREQITEDIRFERLAREEMLKTLSWKIDRVVASYNQDQNRLSQMVTDALRQLSDKSATAQSLSSKLQEETTQVKKLALSLQEEATLGLKLVTEKTEESIRRLQAIQERQGDSLKDLKSTVQYDVKGLKDQLIALESKLRSDFSKQFSQDHLVRDGLSSRLRDCEDVIRQTERKVWGKYTALEDKTNKAIEQFKRDVEDSRSKLLGSLGEFRVRINENKQELQSVETKVELKLNAALASVRSINLKSLSELEELRGELSDLKRSSGSGLAQLTRQLDVLESVVREQFEQMQRVRLVDLVDRGRGRGLMTLWQLRDPETLRNATIVVQHARMERRSGISDQLDEEPKEFAYLQYR